MERKREEEEGERERERREVVAARSYTVQYCIVQYIYCTHSTRTPTESITVFFFFGPAIDCTRSNDIRMKE
jgi:hypothetical protein